jgi:hypothetical protein
MLVQVNQPSSGRLWKLLAVGGVLLLIGLGVYWWTSSSEDVDLGAPASASAFSTTFDTSVLNDVRFKGLVAHGSDVQVSERGRNADPFHAF